MQAEAPARFGARDVDHDTLNSRWLAVVVDILSSATVTLRYINIRSAYRQSYNGLGYLDFHFNLQYKFKTCFSKIRNAHTSLFKYPRQKHDL